MESFVSLSIMTSSLAEFCSVGWWSLSFGIWNISFKPSWLLKFPLVNLMLFWGACLCMQFGASLFPFSISLLCSVYLVVKLQHNEGILLSGLVCLLFSKPAVPIRTSLPRFGQFSAMIFLTIFPWPFKYEIFLLCQNFAGLVTPLCPKGCECSVCTILLTHLCHIWMFSFLHLQALTFCSPLGPFCW